MFTLFQVTDAAAALKMREYYKKRTLLTVPTSVEKEAWTLTSKRFFNHILMFIINELFIILRIYIRK